MIGRVQVYHRILDHERSGERVDYNCDSKDEDILDSGFCIFHDENYLQGKNNDHKEHKQKVRDRLEAKVRNSIDQNEPLLWANALTI